MDTNTWRRHFYISENSLSVTLSLLTMFRSTSTTVTDFYSRCSRWWRPVWKADWPHGRWSNDVVDYGMLTPTQATMHSSSSEASGDHWWSAYQAVTRDWFSPLEQSRGKRQRTLTKISCFFFHMTKSQIKYLTNSPTEQQQQQMVTFIPKWDLNNQEMQPWLYCAVLESIFIKQELYKKKVASWAWKCIPDLGNSHDLPQWKMRMKALQKASKWTLNYDFLFIYFFSKWSCVIYLRKTESSMILKYWRNLTTRWLNTVIKEATFWNVDN